MFTISRKYIYLFVALILTGLWAISRNWTPSKTYCYRHKTLPTLPSIQDSDPVRGRSIFFIETSCSSETLGKVTLNARQACAIESAASQNPHFEVYVLYVSPGVVKYNGTESDRFLQAVKSYRNVHLRHIDMDQYFKDTPVEDLWTSGKVERSRWPYSHTSDVLRYLTLWKYGGIYLDLDVVILRPLNLPKNFAAVESEVQVSAGMLGFEPDGDGHELVGSCLEDLRRTYNGYKWVNNGPAIITRLAYKICNKKNVRELTGKTCRNFTFFPPNAFLPLLYNEWEMYFDEWYVDRVYETIKDSYSIHVWNDLSFKKKLKVSDKVPYVLLAQQYCPRVFKEVDRYF